MTRLLLASASPARRATLRAAGIEPLVAVSSVDEDATLAQARETYGALEPADAVLVLARAKALDVAGAPPADLADATDLVVLGCDSMLELDGEVLGKPRDAADATARWQAMRGRVGTLHTGHWLVDLRTPGEPAARAGALGAGEGGVLGATSSTVVHFADVSDEEIAAYVASGEPLHVAGAFTVDGRGGPFVERIEGDHHGVVGLSLPLLRTLLLDLGTPLHTLWAPSPA